MKNVSQKSIDILNNMLSSSSLTTYPDNLQRKDAFLTEEQKMVFFSDDKKAGDTAKVKLLSKQKVTEKANALSNGNHKPGNAFSQYDYDTIISFLSSYEPYFAQNPQHQKTLLTIVNSVKAARSEASPYGLISTIRLYELLKAAHYHKYRVELNRGNRYESLIQTEHAKEWVKFHRDISTSDDLVVSIKRSDLLEVFQLAEVSVQDIKTILDKIISSMGVNDDDAHELVTYILENQPHEMKNFTEYGAYNKNLFKAQVAEKQGIVKEHQQIALPITFISTFTVLIALMGGASVAAFISNATGGIELIDYVIDSIEVWHLAIVSVVFFVIFLGLSQNNLRHKKKQSDTIGAQKYYSQSENHKRKRLKRITQKLSKKALASKAFTGKRGYDIALIDYRGNNLSLSSGSLAYDAITSGGFLKGTFNRVYCEDSANFHNVLVHTVSNSVHNGKNPLIIMKDEEEQYFAQHDTNPNTEFLVLSSVEDVAQDLQDRLEDRNLGLIIVDKMNTIDSIKIEKMLHDNYELIQEQNTPVIILQDPIEDDEEFKNTTINDTADQIVEVYAGSLDDKDDESKMFINVVENTMTALTEEISTVQFKEDTTKITEILEIGAEQGFLEKLNETTWIDVQTGYQIDDSTISETGEVFALNEEMYHAISNKVCRLILNPNSEAIESPDTRMIADYEPKTQSKVINPPAARKEIENKEAQQEKTAEPALDFNTIQEQYDEILESIMSYEMDISKAIRFPAFNDPAVPAVQEMQIQLRKTKRLIDQYKETKQGDLYEIVDNVDILHVRFEAAEKTAKKIAWSDVTHEEREDMKLAQNLINQISSPGNPEDMRKNLYIKLKEVVNRLNKRHEIIPTNLVLELEKNSALALPSSG